MNIDSTEELIFDQEVRQRLDAFLSATYTEYSRSYWNNMISHGYVLVEGKKSKSGLKLNTGHKISVSWPKVTRDFAGKIEVIFEDDRVIVINKPAGMLVHSKGDFNPEYTVSDYAVENGANEFGDTNRNGIVHRLDRHTSGVMIIAKSIESLKFLQEQFASRTTRKLYLAVAEGHFADDEFRIDVPLARNKKDPKTFIADEEGKNAVTDVQVINNADLSIVALRPLTGRTHQLRTHLSHIHHPIVGDGVYKAQTKLDGSRFLLHAYALKLEVAPGDEQTFISEIPADMLPYINDEATNAISTLEV